MKINNNSRLNYIIIGLSIFAGYLLIDFVAPILTAVIFAIAFTPLYNWSKKWIKYDAIAAIATITASITMLVVPALIILYFAVVQLAALPSQIVGLEIDPIVDFVTNDSFNQFIQQIGQNILQSALNLGQQSFILLLSILLYFVIYYEVLVNFKTIKEKVVEIIPSTRTKAEELVNKIEKTTNSMLISVFTGALSQAIATYLGLILIGFNNAFLFSGLTLVSAMFPTGSALITVPISIYLLATGSILKGIFFLIYSLIVVNLVDNIVRAYSVPRDASLSPTVTLIGITGGVATFGIIGIVAGPLVFAILVSLIQTRLGE